MAGRALNSSEGNVDADEEDENSRMETELSEQTDDPSRCNIENENESAEVLRCYEDQMDCEDVNSVLIDDDSSSSKPFPEIDGASSDSIAAPSEGRRNKRKNFLPRNIVYNNQQEENPDNPDDSAESPRAAAENVSGVEDNRWETSESPLDLSEAPLRQCLLPTKFSPIPEKMEGTNETSESPTSMLRCKAPTESNCSEEPLDPQLPDFAQMAMRRLLRMYGVPPDLAMGPAGKIFSNLFPHSES